MRVLICKVAGLGQVDDPREAIANKHKSINQEWVSNKKLTISGKPESNKITVWI